MTIGAIIKKLRREQDMTQEQLAECLGISAASVSQWECDKTAPDISQLPILANIFDVTTDYILGVDGAGREKGIRQILEAAGIHKDKGHPELALPILKQGIIQYPTSHKIMLKLIQTYNSCIRQSITPAAEKENYGNEIIRLGKKILSECTEDRIRNSTRQILCYTYESKGMYNEIKELANSQSSLCTSYEDFMVRAHTGTQKHMYKKLHLVNCLIELIQILSGLNTTMDDGQKAYSVEEEIEIRKKIISLIDLIMEDGEYGFFGGRIIAQHQAIAALYAETEDSAAALAHLAAAAKQAIIMDTAYDPKKTYGSLLLRGKTFGGVAYHSPENYTMALANAMNHARYDFVRTTPEFTFLIEQLLPHAAERA